MFSSSKKDDNPSGNKSSKDELKSGQVLFLPTEESEQGPQQQISNDGPLLFTKRDANNRIPSILNTEIKDEGEPILIGSQRDPTSQNIFVKESAKQVDVPILQKKEIQIEVASYNSRGNAADSPARGSSRGPSIALLNKKTTFLGSNSMKDGDQAHNGLFFQRTKNVKKFIQKLRMKTSSFLMGLVTRFIFALINDLSSDFSVFTNQRAFKLLGKSRTPFRKYFMRGTSVFSKIMDSSFGVFHPENQIILIWEVFYSIYLLSQIIIQPLRDSFPENFRGYNSAGLYFHEKILPFIAFTINSFFLFNTAVFKKGQLMKKRAEIFKKNIRKTFLYEAVIIGMYYLGAFLDGYFIFEYFMLLKFVDFFSLVKKFTEIYDHNRQKLIYTQSALIISQILLVAHVSASIFITVAKGASPAITWLDKLKEVTQITNPSATQIYVSGLYWSIITMVTLGYGDIVPISQREKLFVICVAFVSCALFGYSFNLIGEIINESRKNKTKLKNDLEMLNSLMEDRGLNHELKSKVRRYFAYLQKEKLKNFEIGQEMIGALPPALKDEVMYDLYSKLLKSLPLFSDNFSEQFIQDLSICIKEFKTGPELIIQKKNTIQDKLYFIIRGEVMQYWDPVRYSDSCIQILKKGNTIGLQEFITQTPIEYYSKSESVTSISYFTYAEFLEILAKHPKDSEIYYKIKDKININQQGKFYGMECPFCKKGCHLADQCPLIRYQPNTYRLHREYKKLELVQQERNDCKENNQLHKTSKKNTFNIFHNVQKCSDFFVNNLQAEMDDSGQQLNIQFEESSNHLILQQQGNNDEGENEQQQHQNEDIFTPVKNQALTTPLRLDFSSAHPQQQQQQQQQKQLFSIETDKGKDAKLLQDKSGNFEDQVGVEDSHAPVQLIPSSKILFFQPRVNNPIEESVDLANEVENSRYGAISSFMQKNKQKKPDFSIIGEGNKKITDNLSTIIDERSQTIVLKKPFSKFAATISGGVSNKNNTSEKNISNLMRRLTTKDVNLLQLVPTSPTPQDNNNNQNPNQQQLVPEDDAIELPFMNIYYFDKFCNYQFYFPHNNLRQILRDVEAKRMAYIQKGRIGQLPRVVHKNPRMQGSMVETKKK